MQHVRARSPSVPSVLRARNGVHACDGAGLRRRYESASRSLPMQGDWQACHNLSEQLNSIAKLF